MNVRRAAPGDSRTTVRPAVAALVVSLCLGACSREGELHGRPIHPTQACAGPKVKMADVVAHDSMEGGSGCSVRLRDGIVFKWMGPAYELPADEWRGCSAAERKVASDARPCP